MKQKFLSIITAAVLLLVMVACTENNDNSVLPSQQEMEKSLVGLRYKSNFY